MTIPTKSSIHMMSSLMSISCNCILDGTSQNMTIMWQTSCKRRAIIKSIFRTIFGKFKRFLKTIFFKPKLGNFGFFSSKIDLISYLTFQNFTIKYE